MSPPPAPPRVPGDRRSGAERRDAVLPFPAERRRAERRGGLDRRGAALATRDQLRSALELLIRAAEDPTLDDVTIRQVDAAVIRIWSALEALEAREPAVPGAPQR